MVKGQSSSAAQPKPEKKKKAGEPPVGHLVRAREIPIPSEIATSIAVPLACDGDGNIFLQTENSGVSGVRKLSPKGERLAVFQPSANPDLKLDGVGNFALGQGGELYQFAFPHEITRYLLAFKSDGTYKSAIKLHPGFPWMPSALAVLPSGNFLISGLEDDRDHHAAMWPITGIFSSDGSLLKEIKLQDDDDIRDMAASGDARVASPTNQWANRAVEFSRMEAASDGNIYLMRWTTPAIIYAISPGGEVVRRFTVDPGEADYKPVEMHISGNRIALLFFQPQTMETRMKIVDLEGHEIATYDEARAEGKAKFGLLGTVFACYTANPESFTFLTTGANDTLELAIAEPR
jgi:hypothetical protein